MSFCLVMDAMDKVTEPTITLVLPQALIISTVTDFLISFRDSIKDATTLLIDASQLNQMDAAGIQLLVYCLNKLEKMSHQVRWSGDIPELLINKAAKLGLSSHLQLVIKEK